MISLQDHWAVTEAFPLTVKHLQACRNSVSFFLRAKCLTFLRIHPNVLVLVPTYVQHSPVLAEAFGARMQTDCIASWLEKTQQLKLVDIAVICCVSLSGMIYDDGTKIYWSWHALCPGGAELLLAHGLPLADWAAKKMNTQQWNAAHINDYGLSKLAGNSMASPSATCFDVAVNS